jgi:diguanylate cyclase (GGDEF)-like protein
MDRLTRLLRRSLAAKLALALGLLTLPVIGVGAAGLVFLDRVSQESQRIAEEARAASAAGARVHELLIGVQSEVALAGRGGELVAFERAAAGLEDAFDGLSVFDVPGEPADADAAKETWVVARGLGEQALSESDAAAIATLQARFDSAVGGIQTEVGQVTEALLLDSAVETRALERQTVYEGIVVVVALALSLAIAIVGGRRLHRSVAKPVSELREATDRLGSNDLTARAAIEREDELGRLGADFNRMAERLERANAALSGRSLYDPLTELVNRALFLDRCEHVLERLRRRTALAGVLLLDLDDFTRVNDSLGHSFGDRLLIFVADRLRGSVRSADTVARMGGDQFGVILEDLSDQGDAYIAARRIVDAIAEPYLIDGNEVRLTASVGVSVTNQGAEDHTTLLRNADLARCAAKRAGGGRFESFRPELYESAIDRVSLENDLRNAVANGEIAVVYQPIIAIDTGAVMGVEALVRWAHPHRGVVAPADFIPAAESNGVIEVLGREVLRIACRDLAQMCRVAGYDLYVAVNVSSLQFRSEQFAADVAQALEEAELEGNHLVVELTEGSLVDDPQLAQAQMRELKALGVRIALDDFGTGDSALSFLARFPIDVLKIDRSFVSSPDSEGLAQARVTETMVSLARTLRLTSVAEGVETLDQARELAGMGCDLVQGFFFAKPLRRDAVVALVGDRISVAYRRRQLAA